MAQAIAAAYRTRYHLNIEAGERGTHVSRGVGLGEIRCATCTAEDKRDRGGCPYVPQAQPGTVPLQVDSTGDRAHDWIACCPVAVRLAHPGVEQAVALYPQMKAAGGPGLPWSGRPFGELPPRVSLAWALLEAVADRFQAEVSRTRREVDAESLRRRGAPPRRAS